MVVSGVVATAAASVSVLGVVSLAGSDPISGAELDSGDPEMSANSSFACVGETTSMDDRVVVESGSPSSLAVVVVNELGGEVVV